MKFIKLPLFKFLLFANILLLISNIPLFILNSRTPSNTIFPLNHTLYYVDYYGYLAAITQGAHGFALFKDPYTSEITSSGIFYLFYIMIGKLAGLFHLWAPLAYHLARIIVVELFFLASFLICGEILGPSLGFLAALISLLVTTAPIPFFMEKASSVTPIYWWNHLDSLHRLYVVPHHLFGQTMGIFALYFYFHFLKNPSIRILLVGVLSAIIAGLVLPPSLFPLLIALPLSCLIHLLKRVARARKRQACPPKRSFDCVDVDHEANLSEGGTRDWKDNQLFVSPVIIIILAGVVTLIFSWWQTKQGFPWNVYSTWEVARWNMHEPNFNKALLLIFGFSPLFAAPAIYKILKSESPRFLVIVFWAFLPFMMLPFVNLLSIGKVRLVATALNIPWGILVTLTIFQFVKKRIVKMILIILFLLSSLPVTLDYLIKDIKYAQTAYLYNRVSLFHAFDFIRKNIPPGAIFLSDEFKGIMIPGFTPTVSYFAHINLTRDFFQKQSNVWLFFTQQMSSAVAKKFVTQNKISYVYYGVEEKKLSQSPLTYDFLKAVFQQDDITIFKVVL